MSQKWDALGVKSDLQKLLVRRLAEEMEARSLSANALARIAKGMGHQIGQTTISAILRGELDPTLSRLEAMAEGIGIPAWYLLTDAGQVEQRVIKSPTQTIPGNVVRLSSPYPSIFKKTDPQTKQPRVAQKKKR